MGMESSTAPPSGFNYGFLHCLSSPGEREKLQTIKLV